MKRTIIIISIMLLSKSIMAGCGSDDSNEGATQPTAELTRSMLAGEWCYKYYEAGYGDEKEREEENITYIFKDDGTLLYQNSSASTVDRPGSYELTNGELKIKPTLMFIKTTIRSASEDRFELGTSTTHLVFTRGACGE